MIEELIARVFYARNVAHFEHWRATGKGSYAKHQALGAFYEEVIEALDDLVEGYQGAFGLIGNIPAPGAETSDVLVLLKGDAEWVEDNHDDVCKGIRAIANLLDGVTDVYLRTIYKLENLQ